MSVVMDGELLLRIAAESEFSEFDDEGTLIKLFIKAGLEGIQNGVGGTNDDFRELGVGGHKEERGLTTDFTDWHR